jgi:hypothetical protein
LEISNDKPSFVLTSQLGLAFFFASSPKALLFVWVSIVENEKHGKGESQWKGSQGRASSQSAGETAGR